MQSAIKVLPSTPFAERVSQIAQLNVKDIIYNMRDPRRVEKVLEKRNIIPQEDYTPFTLQHLKSLSIKEKTYTMITRVVGTLIYLYTCMIVDNERREHKHFSFDHVLGKISRIRTRKEGRKVFHNEIHIHTITEDALYEGTFLNIDTDIFRFCGDKQYVLSGGKSVAHVSHVDSSFNSLVTRHYFDIVGYTVPFNFFVLGNEVYCRVCFRGVEETHIYHAASMHHVATLPYVAKDILGSEKMLYVMGKKEIHIYSVSF